MREREVLGVAPSRYIIEMGLGEDLELDVTGPERFHEGRLDLRRAKHRRVTGRSLRFQAREITNVDFTQTTIGPIWFQQCTFANCLFDEAQLELHSKWCVFERCSFRKARCSGYSSIGNECDFIDCSFVGTSFRGMRVHDANFTRAVFDHAAYRDTIFCACNFTDCEFRGPVKDVAFYAWLNTTPDQRGRMQNVSFEEVGGCLFGGYDLGDVKLPSHPDMPIVRDFQAGIETLLRRFTLRGKSGDFVRRHLEGQREYFWPGLRTNILDIATMKRFGLSDEDADEIKRILAERD